MNFFKKIFIFIRRIFHKEEDPQQNVVFSMGSALYRTPYDKIHIEDEENNSKNIDKDSNPNESPSTALPKNGIESSVEDSKLSAENLYKKAQYYDKILKHEKGAHYYLKAAEAGHAEAQYKIAGYYCKGIWEIPKNVELAIMWYKKAADNGHKWAKEEYEKLQLIN